MIAASRITFGRLRIPRAARAICSRNVSGDTVFLCSGFIVQLAVVCYDIYYVRMITLKQLIQIVVLNLVFVPLVLAALWALIRLWRYRFKPRLYRMLGRKLHPMSPDEYMWYLVAIGDLQAGIRETKHLMETAPLDDEDTSASLRARHTLLQERLGRMEHAYKARLAAEHALPPVLKEGDG